MAEETAVIEKTIKKSPVGRWLWTVSTMLVLPVFAWLGNEALDTIQGFSKTIETLHDRILILESNKSNNEALWSAISENRNKLMDIRVEHEAEKKHLNWLSENWILIQTPRGSGQADPDPAKRPPVIPAPKPVPVVPGPVELPPKVNPKDFRAEYEHRFPNQQQQKK